MPHPPHQTGATAGRAGRLPGNRWRGLKLAGGSAPPIPLEFRRALFEERGDTLFEIVAGQDLGHRVLLQHEGILKAQRLPAIDHPFRPGDRQRSRGGQLTGQSNRSFQRATGRRQLVDDFQLLQLADQLLKLPLLPTDFLTAGVAGQMLEQKPEIDARAEALVPRPGENQRPKRFILCRLVEGLLKNLQHLIRKSVALLWAIEGDDEHLSPALADQVWHYESSCRSSSSK